VTTATVAETSPPRRARRWAGSRAAWLVLAVVAAVALAIGAARSSGARTPEERIDAIAKTLKCPVCPGESLYESRNNVSLNLKAEIAREVRAGQTDDEIRAAIVARYGDSVLLVPRAEGVDALVWVLPVALLVVCVAALVVVFRRWRREGSTGPPTDADRALVAEALAGQAATGDAPVAETT
jgi:cytochrome c-type biogenesis protein CcmH